MKQVEIFWPPLPYSRRTFTDGGHKYFWLNLNEKCNNLAHQTFFSTLFLISLRIEEDEKKILTHM